MRLNIVRELIEWIVNFISFGRSIKRCMLQFQGLEFNIIKEIWFDCSLPFFYYFMPLNINLSYFIPC